MVDVMEGMRKIGRMLSIDAPPGMQLTCEGFDEATLHTTPSYCPSCKYVAYYVSEADVHFRVCEECGHGVMSIKIGTNIWKSMAVK